MGPGYGQQSSAEQGRTAAFAAMLIHGSNDLIRNCPSQEHTVEGQQQCDGQRRGRIGGRTHLTASDRVDASCSTPSRSTPGRGVLVMTEPRTQE